MSDYLKVHQEAAIHAAFSCASFIAAFAEMQAKHETSQDDVERLLVLGVESATEAVKVQRMKMEYENTLNAGWEEE